MRIFPNNRWLLGVAASRCLWRVGLCVSLALLLTACASRPSYHIKPAPPAHHAAPSGDAYLVQRGDTLYSIAFRLDMNFKTLAKINNIDPPYLIYAGQHLVVPKSPPADEPHRPVDNAARPAPPPIAPATPPPLPTPVPAPAPVTIPSAPTPPAQATEPPPEAASTEASVYDGHVQVIWRWPLAGAMLRSFQDGGNKGIDIAAREGEPVAVAADGKVVYSGQGLIGYGNLIIVKHSDKYLSAYGNNSGMLIKEGDEVTAGQPIAEVGSVGGREASLHFEIRRVGKPVDPLDYLPKR